MDVPNVCGHMVLPSVAGMSSVHGSLGMGSAKRKEPRGGSANGIPRNARIPRPLCEVIYLPVTPPPCGRTTRNSSDTLLSHQPMHSNVQTRTPKITLWSPVISTGTERWTTDLMSPAEDSLFQIWALTTIAFIYRQVNTTELDDNARKVEIILYYKRYGNQINNTTPPD